MTDEWLNQFEAQLEQLERAAQDRTLPFAELVLSATTALAVLAEDASLRMWLSRPQQLDRLAADGTTHRLPEHSEPNVTLAVERGHLFCEFDSGRRLFAASPLADQMSFVLAVDHSALNAPEDSVIQGTQAVAQIVGARVSQYLLSQYEQRLQGQSQLLSIMTRLQDSDSVQQAANIMAQDAAPILHSGRTSVLTRIDNRFELQAITGVTGPKAAAEIVQALQVAASDPNASQAWMRLDSCDGPTSPEVRNAFSVLQRGGTQQLRVIPLTDDVVMIIENFADSQLPDDSTVQQLATAAGPVFHRHMDEQRSWWTRWLTTRRQRWLVGVVLFVSFLTFVPTDFEVEVPGRILAANQQHIFAPENGTIDEVHFENESAVIAGQTLLKMSNPDLELELRRIQGDIDTTTAKLAAARASRLTSADARFSGDEQQLQKELENLTQQHQLVQQQAAALLVQSPLSGTAFRRDPQQELLARPVQRGQRLLDIVPDNAEWQLDLAIPARLLNYVTEYRRQSDKPARVRYLLRSAPQQDWTTQLSNVENAVQIQDSELVCRATAKLAQLPETDLRPGTSVLARIHCGRRSIGFVWFREVWEFWQQFQFACL